MSTRLNYARELLKDAFEESVDILKEHLLKNGEKLSVPVSSSSSERKDIYVINTSNPNGEYDNIYGYVWNGNQYSNDVISEYPLNAVMLDNNRVYVHLGEDYGDSWENFSEIMQDEGNWYALDFGNNLVPYITIGFILEAIHEYPY